MPTYCPKCQKDDRIYPVSAVHSRGISHGTFSSTDGTVSGTSQTVLSGRLNPLPKPSIPCFVIGCSGFWVAIGAVGSVYLFLLVRFFESTEILELFRGLASSICLYFGIGLGIYLVASLLVKWKMPRWMAAMEVWNRCYYCDRDGIVFDPTNGVAIPIDSFNDYLKRMESSQIPVSLGQPQKGNTRLIIGILGFVILCSCLTAAIAWQYGDLVIQNLGF